MTPSKWQGAREYRESEAGKQAAATSEASRRDKLRREVERIVIAAAKGDSDDARKRLSKLKTFGLDPTPDALLLETINVLIGRLVAATGEKSERLAKDAVVTAITRCGYV